MIAASLVETSAPFLTFIEQWMNRLPEGHLDDLLMQPERVAVLSVDVINGFCKQGPLASPRVAGIITPIAALLQSTWERGCRQILLLQDTHEPDAVEFNQFPPHCIRGTFEAEAVDELKALSFFDEIQQIPKNSIHSGLNTGLIAWINEHPLVDTFVVVGDCTDLCVNQLAMHLRLDANARQLKRRVILPANCVETYDLPVETALEIGAVAHSATLLHAIFLHHMALNGIEVLARLA